ncbi:MAG TPA: TIGR00730 family Rossman fold protein [Flavobacteriales bacterium]|nr:TIGR00730 family Rossman fold protein [Flavobacteriales bacterium]HMZ47885.1 TIGR00730 family Rossman fold protein [Flavobacteriales bacterium]HNI04400.1 TIGR00730 family Rossman fold protein [Flavobacteriales bacterium]HNK67586.1 TIGR00730 family Rossman fold protein [Flavobacteriales bacterium]HNK84686.1 TIGR00730 family Rossman fold protein [Flavobacteriales bacterium]
MPRIAVFCGASSGHAAHWKALAAEVGRTLALNKFGIVYGGGHVGLMGVVADAAMKAGGEVIGVIPRFMEKSELAHQGVTELILVDTMHQRKQRMHELSDVVIALPGGFGTMDELFELLTWRQIGLHRQPIGLLNAHGFYDPLLDQVRLMRREGFLHGETDLIVADTITALLDRLC